MEFGGEAARMWGRRAVLGGASAVLGGGAARAQSANSGVTIVNSVVIGRDGWLFSAAAEPASIFVRAVYQAVCDLITETAATLRGAGITPILMLIPSKNRVYRPFTNSTYNPPDFANRYSYLLGELRRANTIAPDIDSMFRRVIAERPGESLYFRADTHWTPRGAEVTAAMLARAMREVSPPLPRHPKGGTALAPPVVQTHAVGDLQRLLPPERRAGMQPEEYRIRLPVQGNAGSLLDEGGPADVALVGPSFLEPRYSYADVVSNQIERPVMLSWRPNTHGPYNILLDYLRSTEFRLQRPKVLVWHLLEINMQSGPNVSDWARTMTPAQFRTELRTLVGAGA